MTTTALLAAALFAADPVVLALRPSAEIEGALVRVGDIAAVVSAPEGVASHIEAVVVVLARESAAPLTVERSTVERRLAEHGVPDVTLSGADVVIVKRAAPRPPVRTRDERVPPVRTRDERVPPVRTRDERVPRSPADPDSGGPAKASKPAPAPAAVRDDGDLRVIFRGRFVEISERGRPLRAGAPGDIIPVRLEGGRTIQARIERPGVAVPVAASSAKEAP